ncbi:hypothetical protein J3458_020279 [Metarhizium acridum]|uniref:uncharacterized protein n=1 Tax=Metarhizium acridum TaxID=92637 RepID=UPI001C6BBDA3|nr:hypothetical protein J3458_020285 [Metarhizium acridum]KAG8407974.1 hypothetical protein J3458_020279 [Metarhizium acridum]
MLSMRLETPADPEKKKEKRRGRERERWGIVDTKIIVGFRLGWTNVGDPHHPNYADPAKKKNPSSPMCRWLKKKLLENRHDIGPITRSTITIYQILSLSSSPSSRMR